MDGSAIAKVERPKRQRRSIAEKRKIVEQAMLPGASVAGVARQHGVNANMVHYWRNLYRQGRLGEKKNDSIRLLPVRINESRPDTAAGTEADVVSDYFCTCPFCPSQATSTSSFPRYISGLRVAPMPRCCG